MTADMEVRVLCSCRREVMQVHTKVWLGIAAESIQFTSNKQEGKREKVKQARGHFQLMKELQRSRAVSYLQITG